MKQSLDDKLVGIMMTFCKLMRKPVTFVSEWTGLTCAKISMMVFIPIIAALRLAYIILWPDNFFMKAILAFFSVFLVGFMLLLPAYVINKVLEAVRDEKNLAKEWVDAMFSFAPMHAWFTTALLLFIFMGIGTIIAGGEEQIRDIHATIVNTFEFVAVIWMWTLTIPPKKSKLRSLIENVTPEPAAAYSPN